MFNHRRGHKVSRGLKGMHGTQIYVPRESSLQPHRDRLEERYPACRAAS